MASKVYETTSAKDELFAALSYIEDVLDQPAAAAKLAAGYVRFIENVGSYPEMYPYVCEKSLQAKGYRKATLKNYLVLYRYDGSTVYVIHLFHQSQDYARLV